MRWSNGHLDRNHRREAILEYLKAYWNENGYAPCVREIADAVDINISSVFHWLDRLEEEGRITRKFRKCRTIKVVES